MGQRLVVTITQNGENIAALYYHWSAYTLSSLYETRDILNVLYDDDNDEKDLRLRLIRFCEKNGGGIDGGENSDEWNYIQSRYPNEEFKKDGISRNNGLIAISEKGIDEMLSWSEGNVCIDLDEDNVDNSVYSYYADIDYYNDDHSEWDDEFKPVTLEDIPSILGDFGSFNVSDIDSIIRQIECLDGYVCRNNDGIYELVA